MHTEAGPENDCLHYFDLGGFCLMSKKSKDEKDKKEAKGSKGKSKKPKTVKRKRDEDEDEDEDRVSRVEMHDDPM